MNKNNIVVGCILVAIAVCFFMSNKILSLTNKESGIPYEAVEYNGHHYHVFYEVCRSMEEAETYCESRGGHLVVISSPEEDARVNRIARDSGYLDAFIGLSYDATSGQWGWVDNSDISYVNWAPLAPHDEGNWLYARYDVSMNGGWTNQAAPDGFAAFICEWDK